MRKKTMKKVCVCVLGILSVVTIVVYRLMTQQVSTNVHIKSLIPLPTTTSLPRTTTSLPTTKIFQKTTQQDEELQNILKLIEWPLSPANTSLEFSTHPRTSEFFLLHPRSSYVMGERLEVLIIAKDHKGRPKSYGGDYFHAKLHSPSLKAGVTGSVTDNYDGSYVASFILQWPGETMVSIKLRFSSEAITIMHEKRDTRPDKIYSRGYYARNGTEEIVECNLDLPGQDVCEYYDERYDEKWVCQRPKALPCDAYRDHIPGPSRKVNSDEEEKFFSANLTDQEISTTMKSLNVLLSKDVIQATNPCTGALKLPDPSGFYYQDVWRSLVCSNLHFNNGSEVSKCLSDKMIYMFGDSTLRGWWEYLVKFVPTLKEIDLHVTHHPGPLLATDAEHNYLVQFRAHQKPLRMLRTSKEELHFIAEELDGLGARKGMVIVFNCWAHFTSFPVRIYIHRLRNIRKAVIRLLERSPDTKVIIKSANTGKSMVYVNEWLSYQLDTIMRAMFSTLPVTILDVWQMTSCHHSPQNLHPVHIVVKNEVDLMLSYICPQ